MTDILNILNNLIHIPDMLHHFIIFLLFFHKCSVDSNIQTQHSILLDLSLHFIILKLFKWYYLNFSGFKLV